MAATIVMRRASSGQTARVDAPIGVLDSGLGGLSIVRALQSSLPNERILYYADSAFCPYGERDNAFIRQRTLSIANTLEEQGAKAIVIACNTACAASLDAVREKTSVPVIGLEPAVKPAAALSRTGRIAVFATPRTIASERLASLVARYGQGCAVELIAAPDWAGIVERGETATEQARNAVTSLVRPALGRGADVLVLGCTHYPFLGGLIREAAGPEVAIVDSGAAIARRTRQILDEEGMLAEHALPEPHFSLLTSSPDASPVVRQAMQMLAMPFS
jgi:glutamate racemase